MERYDQLYRLYEEFDADAVRAYRDFVALFPPVDSKLVLDRWQYARDELRARKDAIREAFPEDGDDFAEIAATATANQAFTALDLYAEYGRAVNALVLDVDETLRSAGGTDNEIPRETLYLLTECHEDGVPIVVCTGQTLENVKGFMIQGLGNRLVHSGEFSIVYEAGTGVFTPGHGADTKQLLYDELDAEIRSVFDAVRSRVLSAAPDPIRTGCHLQGNEFNVTLKPNFETGSDRARSVVEEALDYQLGLLGDAVTDLESTPDADSDRSARWARSYYASRDPEIAGVLADRGTLPDPDPEVPATVRAVFDRVDVAYHEADAAEITSLELNKLVGVEAAFEVLGIEDPFAVVMGDSTSDLRVMEWAHENDHGVSAAPEHAAPEVLEHVRSTDGLVYDGGNASAVLRTVAALNRIARVDG